MYLKEKNVKNKVNSIFLVMFKNKLRLIVNILAVKKLIYLSLIIILFSTNNSFANPNWNIKFTVTNPGESYRFCRNILKMSKVENLTDFSDTPYRVKFRNSPLQLHFKKLTNNNPRYLSSLNKMTLENTFIKDHATLMVNDLDYYLEIFIENNIEFLGPIVRRDGIYQLYFEIPGHAFLEFQSTKKPELVEAITMRNVNIDTKIDEEPFLEVFPDH